MKKIFSFMILLCTIVFIPAKASECRKDIHSKIIQVAGIIIDTEDLSPLENAKLYDENGTLFATTDFRGYFKGMMKTSGEGIHFKIRIEKSGYRTFTQKENWADLGSSISSIYYFGLEKNTGKLGNSFSEMLQRKDLSYDSVISGFDGIKEKIDFNHKLEAAKSNNQNVFFAIGQDYYLLNNGGWLKISSPDDRIAINKSKIVKASEINSVVKRSQIKGMSPADSKEYSYEIYLK